MRICTTTLATTLAKALALGTLALGAVACGDSDEAGTGTITQAFSSNCSSCHGASGNGVGDAPSIPGDLSQEQFVATVRSGRGRMPAFSASQISDAELADTYAALKAR